MREVSLKPNVMLHHRRENTSVYSACVQATAVPLRNIQWAESALIAFTILINSRLGKKMCSDKEVQSSFCCPPTLDDEELGFAI